MKLLIVDNNDSFTYNLVQIVEETGLTDFDVLLHDRLILDEVKKYDKIMLSPGPSLPDDFSVLKEILKHYGKNKSIFGICLGLQCIAEYFGGSLYNLEEVVHGQARKIRELSDKTLFRGLPEDFIAGLYHSWAVSEDKLPDCLDVTSRSEFGTIMSLRHKTLDIRGVQFHPESYITKSGPRIIRNWLES